MIGEEITLKRLMSQPPCTAFYGSKATIIKGWIQSKLGSKHRITFDTGLEITLINEDLIPELSPVPKIKSGQKLKLVQVTGNSTISRYVIVPLIFDTDLGPVKMTVEAYIVPKMNAPFILGTDFASQFQLLLIRDNSGTRIQFGDTGRSIKVEESETSPQVNSSGSFKVEISSSYSSNRDKRMKSKKLQNKRQKDETLPPNSTKVKSIETIVIPPETIKKIKVETQFNPVQQEGFVQRDFGFYRNQDNIYAVADCLITTTNPALYSASPAKQEVIEKQVQDWKDLGVIEESKSPWGFPGIVVYRNSKPHLCTDYRRLNEVAVPDEYPLPKQTDILHTLEGSLWLSTLDALTGFTQLSIKEEDQEKTAFRCHKGLFHFKQLPFGFRNGPTVFQRVMNNVLAPY
jgi:hypothetical protein